MLISEKGAKIVVSDIDRISTIFHQPTFRKFGTQCITLKPYSSRRKTELCDPYTREINAKLMFYVK